ncbi:MAG: lipopolysaccharide biosynthesis protein [Alistipes sp.]|nr:lipopolysaccharide biosynthesis protein [Alistipes sp.]
MDQMQNQNINIPEEQEIDLVELIQRMWVNRWLIVKVTAVFMVLGVLVALFSPKVFTASCDVVPQTSKSGPSSSMSSLAALAGINLNAVQSAESLSPEVYENIMGSTTFRKELMQTMIDFEKVGHPVSFFDYYTSEEYNKPGVLSYVKKYTIGLPFTILNAIRGEQPEPDYSGVGGDSNAIETISKDEYDAMQILGESIGISLDDKKGYVTITANMPEAVAAAQMAQATLTLLQRYITEFKIEKVQSNLDFVQERFDEAKRNFEDVQARRARLRDANMNTTRYSARTEMERLDAEYTLAQGVYTSLAQQVEQAKISVKETTPILTVIKPVTVPYKKSKPQRAMILFAFTFLGAVAGMGCVLLVPAVAEIVGSERMKRFVKELPAKSDVE